MSPNGHGSSRAGRLGQRDPLQLLASNAGLTQAYEALMSSLRLLNGTPRYTTLLFTSAQPEEGKTTVTLGLALAMARGGKRTLIVDADLRRPRIHRLLGLQNTAGLVQLVTGDPGAMNAVQRIDCTPQREGQPYALSVVTSGCDSGNAFDVIQSPTLADSIRSFAGAYDAVLIDSPPVLSVSDALLLAPLVDGVVLIVNTGAVTSADARRAKQRLEDAGGRVLGVIMNRFDESLHGPGFHPYRGYYAGKPET